MDASGADKLILLLVQTNQLLYDKSAAEYKVKDALEKGDIWQIGVDIAVNSERTTDLRCRFSFLVSRWRCDRSVRFLVSRFSFLVSRFSFLGGGVTGPVACAYLRRFSHSVRTVLHKTKRTCRQKLFVTSFQSTRSVHYDVAARALSTVHRKVR